MYSEKLPPYDTDAEEAVIGSLLIDDEAITEVVYWLKPEDFYHEQHRWSYEACVAIYERHEPINQISLARELDKSGRLKEMGGAASLSRLIATVPTSLHIEYYASVVKKTARSRGLIELGEKVQQIGYTGEDGLGQMLEEVKKYQTRYTDMQDFISPKESADIAVDLIDKYNNPDWALKWGFRDLDGLTAGIFPGELNIIGARTYVGKTQLMLDAATGMKGKKVLFASAEMTVDHIIERRIASEVQVSIRKLRTKGVDDDMRGKIVEIAGKIADGDIYFLRPGVSSLDIYVKAMKMKEAIGLDVVFVDYLQILKDCYGEKENENIRIGRASHRLKAIATELDIPVVCASQLNRNLDHRAEDNKTPVLSDLRGSGSIEQDADVILLLWRENPESKILNIRMPKSRQVEPGGEVQLVWLEKQRRYVDCAK